MSERISRIDEKLRAVGVRRENIKLYKGPPGRSGGVDFDSNTVLFRKFRTKELNDTRAWVAKRQLKTETRKLCLAFIDLFPSILDKIFEHENSDFDPINFKHKTRPFVSDYKVHYLKMVFLGSNHKAHGLFMKHMKHIIHDYIFYIDVLMEFLSGDFQKFDIGEANDRDTYASSSSSSDEAYDGEKYGLFAHIKTFIDLDDNNNDTNEGHYNDDSDDTHRSSIDKTIWKHIKTMRKHIDGVLEVITAFKTQLERYFIFLDSFRDKWKNIKKITYDETNTDKRGLREGDIRMIQSVDPSYIPKYPTDEEEYEYDNDPKTHFYAGISIDVTYHPNHSDKTNTEVKIENFFHYKLKIPQEDVTVAHIKLNGTKKTSFCIDQSFFLPLEMHEAVHLIVFRGDIYHLGDKKYMWDLRSPRVNAITFIDYIYAIIKSMFGPDYELNDQYLTTITEF